MFPAVPFLPPGLSGFRRGMRHLSPAARFTVTLYPCQRPFITVRCTGSAHLPNTGEPCRRCIGCKNTTGPPSRVIRSPNKTTIIIFPAIGVRVPFGSRTYFFCAARTLLPWPERSSHAMPSTRSLERQTKPGKCKVPTCRWQGFAG